LRFLSAAQLSEQSRDHQSNELVDREKQSDQGDGATDSREENQGREEDTSQP